MSITIGSLPDDALRIVFGFLKSKKEIAGTCRRFRGLVLRHFILNNELLDDPISRSYCTNIRYLHSLTLELSKFKPAYVLALVNALFSSRIQHLEIHSNQPAVFPNECVVALKSFSHLQTLTLSWFYQPETVPPGVALIVREPVNPF